MISRIWTVACFTALEELRNRLLAGTVLFGAVLAYFGLVLARLAAGFEERFFRDISFAFLELFALAVAVQCAYRVVQQDMKKGSGAELFFVRPIRRWEYLTGRFKGIVFVLLGGMAALLAVSAVLAAVRGFSFYGLYAVVAVEVYFKVLMMLSLAFLLAAVATSQASYLISCVLVYLSGNVTHLLRMLADRQAAEGSAAAAWLVKPLVYLLPNFSLLSTLNALDGILAGSLSFHPGQWVLSLAYAWIYSFCAWAAAAWLFTRREILP